MQSFRKYGLLFKIVCFCSTSKVIGCLIYALSKSKFRVHGFFKGANKLHIQIKQGCGGCATLVSYPDPEPGSGDTQQNCVVLSTVKYGHQSDSRQY